MPSPITSDDFVINNFSGDICERIRKLLEVSDRLVDWFTWAFNSDGTASQAFKLEFQDIAVAPGVIVFRPISSIPSGYLHCNGQAVSRTTYANLFAILGTSFGIGDGSTTFNLPDLSDKFLMGSGTTASVGGTGGAATVTLTEAQMPTHKHGPEPTEADGFLGHAVVGAPAAYNVLGGGDTINMADTAAAGGSQSHENLPPYFAGKWLVKY